MGVDPLTIGLGLAGAGAIGGALTGDRASARNTRSQQQALQAQQQQQALINQRASGMMQQGQNPFAQMLMGMLGSGMPQGAGSQTGFGGIGRITQRMVAGRDSGGAGGLSFTSPTMLDPALYSAAGYDPAQIGLAPQIDPMMVGGGMIDPSQIPQVGAQNVYGRGVRAQQINPGAIGSQGFNTGQDALMQMINRGIPAQQDPMVALGLQQAGQQFNNSDLFSALAPLDQRLIDQQAAQLQGSAGTLGARFGTAMMDRESQLRGNFAQDIAARNAGLQQQSFESAAQRGLQATGIGAQREQFFAGMPLQQAQFQQQAALGLQQGGLQQSGLIAQLLQANQGAGLQASTTTAQQALQAALANQGAGLQAGGMNQSAMLQALLANQGVGMQGQLANQQAGLQAQTGNAANWLQSMLANQSSLNAGGQFNAAAQNQAGQFNAGQMANTSQFNAMQGQQWNAFMQSILGQASGMQQGQQGMNAQLLAIMAGLPGVGAVQQQPSQIPGAMGDIGQLLMFLPFLQGLNKPKTG